MTTTPDAAAKRAVAGRALLILAALAAAAAAGASIAQLGDAGSEHLLNEAWRGFGLVVFAGLFALVAWRPTGYPGVLELAFLHKLGLALLAWSQLDTADGAWATLIIDGLLALALLVAYVLLGSHRAWRRAQPADAAADVPVTKGSGATGSGRKMTGRKSRDSGPRESLEATKPLPSGTADPARGADRPTGEGDGGDTHPQGPGGIPRPPRSSR
ncbi:hypothetical protein [Nesterenkonia sp. HG001]|uniref:hypothetical protein n=1 Tax=Nesterenkonia sp. HG001 TaxID=2983207 RepID=UPI002AC6BFB2|nr:hypothetical protein [Nesterenkonia sp. HG001]MDZ5078131.1 hypothetical protein [Nesterenkonia sp. HG001]